MKYALELKQVDKYYRQEAVLKGVSLQIPVGSCVALVGENGAGKTSLISSIVDFSEIKAGEIQIFGHDHRHSDARSRLAFLPEQFRPPYFMHGKDFLRYMLGLYQRAYDERQLAAIMQSLDLQQNVLESPVRSLSKGMAQKLGLVAVLMSQRDLLILDEPMSSLDAKARALLKTALASLKSRGKSLFFSTHLLADVEAICDQLVILHQGRIVFSGSVAACCAEYKVDDLEQAYLCSIA